MKQLSYKRQMEATLLGEAITKGLIRDWLKYGTAFFPRGITNMRDYCGRHAESQLALSVNWKTVSKHEEAVASKAATDLFDLVMGLHENLKASNG